MSPGKGQQIFAGLLPCWRISKGSAVLFHIPGGLGELQQRPVARRHYRGIPTPLSHFTEYVAKAPLRAAGLA